MLQHDAKARTSSKLRHRALLAERPGIRRALDPVSLVLAFALWLIIANLPGFGVQALCGRQGLKPLQNDEDTPCAAANGPGLLVCSVFHRPEQTRHRGGCPSNCNGSRTASGSGEGFRVYGSGYFQTKNSIMLQERTWLCRGRNGHCTHFRISWSIASSSFLSKLPRLSFADKGNGLRPHDAGCFHPKIRASRLLLGALKVALGCVYLGSSPHASGIV